MNKRSMKRILKQTKNFAQGDNFEEVNRDDEQQKQNKKVAKLVKNVLKSKLELI